MIIEIKPNLIDRVTSYFSPQAGLRRLEARRKMALFGYDGAKSSRNRGTPPTFQAPESSSTQRDRIQLFKIANDLYNNFGFVKMITAKFASHVCPVKYQARTGDPEIDQRYEDYLAEWFENCDLSGRHNFWTMSRLAVVSQKRDGDMGWIYVKQGDEPIKLQAIEHDRIGGIHQTGTSDKFFGGITIDEGTGRPISYQIFNRTSTGAYSNPRDISSNFFAHYFDPMRIDQYRGISAFHAAVNTLRDLYEILEDEKMAVKWASSFAGVITNELGADKSDVTLDEETTDRNGNVQPLEQISPGRVEYLATGEKMEQFKHDRPSQAFQGFTQTMYGESAMCFNIPLGYLMRMVNMGGPSNRMDAAQAQRVFDDEQTLLEHQLTNRSKNMALFDAIGRKKLPFHPRWWSGAWMYKPRTTIDYAREAQANIDELRAGASNLSKIYGEDGKDWLEEIEQKAKEASEIKKLALKYDVTVDSIQLLTPNGTLPGQAQGAEQSNP